MEMSVVAGVGIGMEKRKGSSAQPLATTPSGNGCLCQRRAAAANRGDSGKVFRALLAGSPAARSLRQRPGRYLLLARWSAPYVLADRAAARRSSVAMVELSMRPSTRAGRKWRWNALTTNSVVLSTRPVGSIA